MAGGEWSRRRAERLIGVVAAVVIALLLALGLSGVLEGGGDGGGQRAAARPAAEAPPAEAPPSEGVSAPFGSLRGEIVTPPSGGPPVPLEFPARVRVTGDPGDRHVWLAALLGPDQYFPQPGALGRGTGSRTVSLGPGTTAFVLVLVHVDDADHGRIGEWIRAGRATGARPPLALPSVRHLDEVALFHVPAEPPPEG
jgi:hypothetical protein